MEDKIMDIKMIGKQIAAMRKERGIKQEELANTMGVTAQAVSKWENGGVPDTELIPKIADFFGVSIDALFGRSLTDYGDLQTALVKKIINTPQQDRFRLVFNYCWDMERALFGEIPKDGSIEEYEKALGKNEQRYSCVLSDHGFTRMGIANRLQYFLLVPEIEDKEKAFFDGIDYVSFFKDFSDKDVFDACVMLNKRDASISFTPGLLVKNMGIEFERAREIINILFKYNLLSSNRIEMDDETQVAYNFKPTPSFVAMLIFVREMIKTPNCFSYYSGGRQKPYLK